MNRIVKRHYPVSKLPDDLREGFDANGHATVMVVPEEAPVEPVKPFADIFESTAKYRTAADDAVDRVRELRDEWAERDAEIEDFRRRLRVRD